MKTIEIEDNADGMIRLTDAVGTDPPAVLLSAPVPCLLTCPTARDLITALQRFLEHGSIAQGEARPTVADRAEDIRSRMAGSSSPIVRPETVEELAEVVRDLAKAFGA